MKKHVGLFSAFIATFVAMNAEAQTVTLPRAASPAATVSQTIGISTATVKYSRPSVKGRTVWGELVPYGWNVQQFGSANPAPWRAGANENTVLELSHPATIEGQAVPAGKYGLFFVVNKDNSGELVLSKEYTAWGNFFYDPAQDQMRAKIQIRDIPATEMLTYEFINGTRTSTELVCNWEKKQLPVKIEFAVDEIVLSNAEAELNGALGFQWQAYNTAANYALANNVHLDKASEWVEQSITRGGTGFPTQTLKANILRKTGKEAEADKLIAEAMKTATEVEINNYGYALMNQGKNDKAIEVLTLNTVRFPKSANAWDSLGEAYAIKGDKKNAVANFKKSLSMNPTEAVRANSEKYLKQLGAM